MPPPILGFEVRITVGHNPVVNALGIFSAVIQLMSVLALKDWNAHANRYIVHGPRNYPATLEVQAWPYPSSGLFLIKHAVDSIYKAGDSLAVAPAVAGPFLPKLVGGLYLYDQQIGYIKCLDRSELAESKVNSILNPLKAMNSTLVLEFGPDDGPQANLTEDPGSFVDPMFPSFTYRYWLRDRRLDLRGIFSAFLDAMATAAVRQIEQHGAVINTASVSGDVGLNLQATPGSTLSWLCVSRLLGLVWIPVIIEAQKHVEMDFQIYFEGRIIGEGSMISLRAPQASVASSR